MLGRFEVLRRMATGGMAEIYLARVRGHAGFEKLVVIKRILPTNASNPRFIEMFFDEARLVATLQHPNIADVHEVGEYQGTPFFAMQYVHGQDVRAVRKAAAERQQGVPLRVSLAIIHATASALDYAHELASPDGVKLELVHRDVSPSNILVSYEGDIKLIDFGVARVTSQSHITQSGTVRGKCPYMSPEQCRGLALDRRSDLFSLGAVLYELTVGRRPFVGASDFEIMNQIVHHDPQPPTAATDGYPRELERIVLKLLGRAPEQRYQTAEALLQDLEAFLDAAHLWVPPKRLSRYMRSLFGERLIAWEQATQGDTATFAEHVALSMEPAYRRRGEDTPPTPVPVVMRLAQEIEAVAVDADVSLAQVYRAGDPNDPLQEILARDEPQDDAHDASVVQRPGDTVTVRTDEAEVFEASVALPAGGDTITVRTGETEMREVMGVSADTDASPWEGQRTSGGTASDTITHRDGDGDLDNTTTVRARTNSVANSAPGAAGHAGRDEKTSPGWLAPSLTGSSTGSASSPRTVPDPTPAVVPVDRPGRPTLKVRPPGVRPRRSLHVWLVLAIVALVAAVALLALAMR